MAVVRGEGDPDICVLSSASNQHSSRVHHIKTVVQMTVQVEKLTVYVDPISLKAGNTERIHVDQEESVY